MVTVFCQKCRKQFNAKPSWIKNGCGKYCSRACLHESNRKGKTVHCYVCGTEVYKSRKALNGSKSGTFFCTKSCQTKWRNQEFTGEKHANWKGGKHAYRRMMKKSGIKPVCGLCKTVDIRVLAVHHIDGDRKNNVVDNLAWLCNNCHHLVHHYPDECKKFMATIV